MAKASPEIIRWVALYVIPQEPMVRAALARAGVPRADVDDLIQEAYCRFATMRSVSHITRPGAYFMQMVKNLWRDALRRSRVISFEDITENANLFVEEEAMGVEAVVAGREQLRLVNELLADLPERCQVIFRLKRIEGLSQREIAERLGVTENVVENDVQKGLRAINRVIKAEPAAKEAASVVERREYGVG